ncbi:MAG: BREX-6 system adenine-specific DNA-methyltransferase PglX [Proteobacteria bacterium]|nr:BREX-6 system adenine-specific DNA-methyltransferase PglX [Pseudomonadota bacterium]
MTPDAKRALSRTIRRLRDRLVRDLHDATEGAYRLSLAVGDAALDPAAASRRKRLETWIAGQIDQLPNHGDRSLATRSRDFERFRREVEKDAAAVLLHRLVYVRLLEVAGLRPVAVVAGGWDSRGYRDFRQLAPDLVRGDDSEGYALLLQLVFDDLSIELPGLFGDARVSALVPIPAATLRAVIEALDDPVLHLVWTDDTALGWIHQFWNDPEREALDAKLHAGGKLENHEIAPKTQMFTERYMVEWLLHNSLGAMWLAMCRKHGWIADVEHRGVLDRLQARRAEWRKKRRSGQVAPDALMPIEPGLEARWQYWVPQPIAADAVDHAPDSVRALKLLDPACGSGHFLVIAFELLFALYREEARHRGEHWTDRDIVESIAENNLHGIDIDPRAVQVAAAALMLVAKRLCAEAEPRILHLVAAHCELAGSDPDDPARIELQRTVEQSTGISPERIERATNALASADHLGTLLVADPAQAIVVDELESFLARHSSSPSPSPGPGNDLGLRLRGHHVAAGVRFVRMIRPGQYDLVVGNPPYQGTARLADRAYIEKHYRRGKFDLYAAFFERSLQLARPGGISALLTMRNWMFIKQYTALREWLLDNFDLRTLGDFAIGAFDEVPNDVLSVVASVVRNAPPGDAFSVAIQPTPLDDKSYDRERTRRKRAAVLCQVGRFEFTSGSMRMVAGSPIVYWWSNEFLHAYRDADKLGAVSPARFGLTTGNNTRFVRFVWEVSPASCARAMNASATRGICDWAPFLLGAAGREWFDPLRDLIAWKHRGLAVKVKAEHQYGTMSRQVRNERVYFERGIAFSTIGQRFSARVHRVPGVISNAASSVYSPRIAQLVCLLNSSPTRDLLAALNPTVHFEIGDVNRVPVFSVPGADQIYAALENAFAEHESHREPSVEFKCPGPSPWRHAQEWAQRAVDGEPLSPYEPEYDAQPATDHLSFAVGTAMGRFPVPAVAAESSATTASLPHGILFLSAASERDSLAHAASKPIRDAWAEYGASIDDNRSLKDYLQSRFFAGVHKPMYESRPIYFPLSSAKKSFVAFVSIHRFTVDTLRALLADHLYPSRSRLDGEITDLRRARRGADKNAVRAAERRFAQVSKWRDELTDFIAGVKQCAEKGPPAPDRETPEREVDARYHPDLDDGVMINAAALWPLLEPQWKEPKTWWKQLALAQGKQDFDWSRLARRYFPHRVDQKCRTDPSLAVAHGCLWQYHPETACRWELRLQDEIAADFTLDEAGSYAARTAFVAEHPDRVAKLLQKEQERRAGKGKKRDS